MRLPTPSHFFYRLFVLAALLCVAASPLSAQLIVEENGSLGLGVDTVSGVRIYVRNVDSPYGYYLKQGHQHTTQNLTGLYNDMERGSGDRIGTYNYLTTQSGTVTGLYNRMGARGSGDITGVRNSVSGRSTGRFTGVSNYLTDAHPDQASSTEPMIGVYTRIDDHYHRPQVYGSMIEVWSRDDDPTHQAYGQYVYFHKSHDTGARSYGVYSHVPESKDYAGYFVGNVSVNGELVLTSDARLKANEDSITSPLKTLMQLRPRRYTFRPDTRFSYEADRAHYGFMAQDVEAVLPALVHEVEHPPVLEPVRQQTEPGGLLERQELELTDAAELLDGVVDTARRLTVGAQEYRVVHEAETLKGVRYTDLIAVLTGAVQEQQALIANLSDEVAALKDELASLRACTQCEDGGSGPITTPGGGLGAAAGAGGSDTERSVDALSVFPNPATGGVTVSHAGLAEYDLRVLSSDGREVLRQRVSGHTVLLDTRGWAAGTYVVEVHSGAGSTPEQQTLIVK